MMGTIKGWSDEVTDGKALLSKIFTRASNSMWSRLALMAAIGITAVGSISFYNFIQVKKFSEQTDTYITKSYQVEAINKDQKILDYIDLCISAVKGGEANTNYYCQEAVGLYKENFVELPNNRVSENIKRAAYGAMRVDMQVRMRAKSADVILDPQRPKLDEITTLILTPMGIALTCGISILLMLATAITTFVLKRRSIANERAASEAARRIYDPLV